MLELHPFCQYPNGGLELIGQTSDRQQELVLLRLDAGLPSGILAEAKETPDLVT